jgi:hypothetical protein
VKKEEDTAKKAFDGAVFAEFSFGPGGRKAGAVFLSFGVPGNDGNRCAGLCWLLWISVPKMRALDVSTRSFFLVIFTSSQ